MMRQVSCSKGTSLPELMVQLHERGGIIKVLRLCGRREEAWLSSRGLAAGAAEGMRLCSGSIV